MGNSETSRARVAPELTSDRRLRATPIIVGAVVAAIVVIGLAVSAWLFTASPPDADGPPVAPTTERTAAPRPGATPVDGSEVLPPDSTVRRPNALPALAPAAPRITAPLPASGSAEAALVEGFPSELAAPLEGSELLDTTVATEGGTMQFSLRARTADDAATVLASYEDLWTSLGLAHASGDAAEGSLSYADAYSSVTVAAQSGGTGLVYTIYGVLRAA